jgi:C1A family cysteine protease
MESAYAINSNSENVIDFSPQQIVDCSSDGNYGCDGGNFEPTFNYLKQQGNKIATEDSYPYVGTKETCTTDGVDQIDLEQLNATLIESGDETALAEALVNYGPMYIAINANHEFVMFYRNGIVTTDDCPPDQLNHAVTLVGYGYDDIIQMSYWLIKNSWGTGWGENGYFRIAKDAGNMCGVASEGWYVTLE